jgi:hypothetical protein
MQKYKWHVYGYKFDLNQIETVRQIPATDGSTIIAKRWN